MKSNRIFPPERPSGEQYANCITDVEDVLIKAKGGMRAGTRLADGGQEAWRNMRKNEMRAWQNQNNHMDGLNNLRFQLIKAEHVAPKASVFTVDCLGHEDPFASQNVIHTA